MKAISIMIKQLLCGHDYKITLDSIHKLARLASIKIDGPVQIRKVCPKCGRAKWEVFEIYSNGNG